MWERREERKKEEKIPEKLKENGLRKDNINKEWLYLVYASSDFCLFY